MVLKFIPVGKTNGMFFQQADTSKIFLMMMGKGNEPKRYLVEYDKDKKEIALSSENKALFYKVPADWGYLDDKSFIIVNVIAS